MPDMLPTVRPSHRQSVNDVAVERHSSAGRAVLAALAICASAFACSSSSPSDTSSGADGGKSSSGSVPVGSAVKDRWAAPPKPLCALSGPPTRGGDVLVWGDEFDGDHVDAARWNVFDWGERQGISLATFAAANLSLSGGFLHVKTTAGSKDPGYDYTSGRIDTAHRFARTYGRMDARARFPVAPGVWYAIWARPWITSYPEMDVEVLGKAIPEIYFVNHWAGGDLPADQRRKYVKLPKELDPREYHVYSVIWKPGLVEWQIDGTAFMQSTDVGVPTTPVQWTINGWVGGWGGVPDANTKFPTEFDVDYIRVYRLDGVIADPEIHLTKLDRPGGAPYNVPPYPRRTDTIDVEIANFDEACFHIEMREGDKLLYALDQPPFSFPLDVVPNGQHTFTFVATDGKRQATASATVTTY